MEISTFKEVVWDYYHDHERHLPWRQPEIDDSYDPYKILVSEIMLQQTQAQRVVPKYHEFLATFPMVQDLAAAPLQDVLISWSGLGYNRRAKFLWQAAQQITQFHEGVFPNSLDELIGLPGVGVNTAQAIRAYAFNQPVTFIETNIRTTFIYHFFPDDDVVSDKQLLPLIEQAVDTEHSREWYWALMDYGVHLKSTTGNASRSSKHYTKQSAFKGSRRQIRGQVLKLLIAGPQSLSSLEQQISDDRLFSVLTDLTTELLIIESEGIFSL